MSDVRVWDTGARAVLTRVHCQYWRRQLESIYLSKMPNSHKVCAGRHSRHFAHPRPAHSEPLGQSRRGWSHGLKFNGPRANERAWLRPLVATVASSGWRSDSYRDDAEEKCSHSLSSWHNDLLMCILALIWSRLKIAIHVTLLLVYRVCACMSALVAEYLRMGIKEYSVFKIVSLKLHWCVR